MEKERQQLRDQLHTLESTFSASDGASERKIKRLIDTLEDTEDKLQREIGELKAEIEQLRTVAANKDVEHHLQTSTKDARVAELLRQMQETEDGLNQVRLEFQPGNLHNVVPHEDSRRTGEAHHVFHLVISSHCAQRLRLVCNCVDNVVCS